MMKSETAPVVRVADGFGFLEGPRWYRGRLFVSDFYQHRVLAFDERGQYTVVCAVPEQPSGLGFTPDGCLLIVSMRDRNLLRLKEGRLTTYAQLASLAPFHCNDMLVDPLGRAYVGNFGWDPEVDPTIHATDLILVQTDGRAAVVASNLVFPNGTVLTPDGRTLLIAETFAARISAFDVAADGTLSNRRIWASFSDRPFGSMVDAVQAGVPLPDGMALDSQGALWIGDAAGRGALRVFEGGRIAQKVETGDLTVFAVALGGSDGRTLYMCASPPLFTSDPRVENRSVLLSHCLSVGAAGFSSEP